MTKTGKKRQKVQMPAGIRNKMMAAVSMLMVSCIMLVSSTYAWFTLSTAPEITGITTNVGANGNLEMMLLNYDSYTSDEDDLGVESTPGDSMAVESIEKANVTWGNLVDLGATTTNNESVYGLDKIALMPSKLNVSDNSIQANPLLTPSYGSDGRVIKVETPAFTGSYANSAWSYDQEQSAGVRALGTISGTTLRVSAYRAAMALVSSSAGSAKSSAQNSLDTNAPALASLLVEQVLGTEQFDKTYLETIKTMIGDVTAANKSVEAAIRNAIVAYNLGNTTTQSLTDADVTTISEKIMEEKMSVLKEGLKVALTAEDATASEFTVVLPEKISESIDIYEQNVEAITEATTNLNSLKTTYENSENVPWKDNNGVGILSVLTPLVNPNNMTVCGFTISQKDEIMNYIMNNVFSGLNIEIVMKSGSGVYYNIALICGSYPVEGDVTVAGEVFEKVLDVSEMKDQEIPFTMTQEVTETAYIDTAINAIDKAGAPEVDLDAEGTSGPTLETYGYMLDFGFRTNAAQANLQLQTDAVQRVYNSLNSENGEEVQVSESTVTQGAGSYMEFTSSDLSTFSVDEMRALMYAVRLAFVKPEGGTYTILQIAAPAITKTESTETPGLFTYAGGEPSTKYATNDTLKVPLYLYNYEITADGVSLGVQKTETAITALEQNKAAKVSVIVYLEGSIVDNTMVANAETSMAGSINLQFSSDAKLVPMYNAGLFNATQEDNGAESEPQYEVVVTGPKEYSQSVKGVNYTINVKEGYTIYKLGTDYYYSADGSDYTKITSWTTDTDAFTVSTDSSGE